MIYVSSSCVKHDKIKDSVLELIENGFMNIELSGGTEFYEGLTDDLLELNDKYDVNLQCHNYFPPPKKHFVLNLASLDDEIYNASLSHLSNSIQLAKKLNSKRFSFHAGFFMDISVAEIGKKLSKKTINDEEKAMKRFCSGYNLLKKEAGELELYIENNVFSYSNFSTYQGLNPFMLVSNEDYLELQNKINFKLLLDTAHLKVSCNTLQLDFENELSKMVNESDYIHLSENDGKHDQNKAVLKDSKIFKALQKNYIKNKDFTLEIYDDLKVIRDSYELLQGIID